MAQPYLDELTKLVQNINPGGYDLACKHFFSGAALYADGQVCASLTPRRHDALTRKMCDCRSSRPESWSLPNED